MGAEASGREEIVWLIKSTQISYPPRRLISWLASSLPPFHVSVQTSHFCHEMKQRVSTPESRKITRTVHLDFRSPEL